MPWALVEPGRPGRGRPVRADRSGGSRTPGLPGCHPRRRGGSMVGFGYFALPTVPDVAVRDPPRRPRLPSPVGSRRFAACQKRSRPPRGGPFGPDCDGCHAVLSLHLLTVASIMEAWLPLSSLTWRLPDQRVTPARPWRAVDLAGICNPYLSPIERGLKKPNADILNRSGTGCPCRPSRSTSRPGSSKRVPRVRRPGGPPSHRCRTVVDAQSVRRPRPGPPGLRQPGA